MILVKSGMFANSMKGFNDRSLRVFFRNYQISWLNQYIPFPTVGEVVQDDWVF